AEELGVDYLVEGSVRKAGSDLRITLQLIEAKDGTHLLSETFDRKLTNVFALQEEISTQVAAALKLTLVHKSDQYNSALETLDYIAVEQLVSARAQIREYAEEPIKIALDALQKLNTQYPNTPEIMGLKVYGQMMLSSVGEFTRRQKGEMSEIKAVLALDSRNKDALYSAAVIYDDDAHTLQQAKDAYQKLIRFYPGDGELYLRMLEYLVSSASPCSELQTFSKTIPEGILDANDTRYVSLMLGACNMSDDPSLTNTSSDDAEQYLRANAWFSADSYYEYISYRHAENPNERFKAVLGALSQNAGASEQAAKFMNEVDHSRVSYWAMYKINSGAIYNIEYDIDPIEFYEANPTLTNHKYTYIRCRTNQTCGSLGE
ncbi:MAG: hypothetical protein KJO69_10530, partial [Gammaproteobacteria bacterium]|nr:hypothetical protein [Gammaproteobacteria bacterium]